MRMTKTKLTVLTITVLLLSAPFIFYFLHSRSAEYSENKWTRLMGNCADVMNRMKYMPEQGIPEGVMLKCQGVGIFPSTISGGLGIGGQYGEGIIIVRDKSYRKWSNPAVFTIAGGSFGLQIGGQSTDIVLLFMDRRSIDAILNGKIKLGADASVAAGPVGRSVSASTDIQFKGGIFSYSMSRGLFVGAKLEGTVISQNRGANSELYGESFSANEILLQNKAPMPRGAKKLIRALNCYNPINYLLRKVFGFKCP